MDSRITCAKLAVKYDLPQWVIYQIAHRMRFNQKLAHYEAACNEVQKKGWEPKAIMNFFNEFDVYNDLVTCHA